MRPLDLRSLGMNKGRGRRFSGATLLGAGLAIVALQPFVLQPPVLAQTETVPGTIPVVSVVPATPAAPVPPSSPETTVVPTPTPSASTTTIVVAPVPPGETTTTIPPSPQQYVAYAVSALERYAYKRNTVDWAAIRAKAEAATANAATFADTHNAISDMVRAINDKHSSFTRPIQAAKQTAGKVDSFGFLAGWPSRVVITVAPGGPAEAAGLKTGDRIDKIDGKLPRFNGSVIALQRDKNGQLPTKITITWSRKGLKKAITKTLQLGEVPTVSVPKTALVPQIPGVNAQSIGKLGYLDVPGIVGEPDTLVTFATQIHTQIQELETSTPRCGWIVDLRRNRGGYIHAMLAGLGPLTEGGVAGASIGGKINVDGKIESWRYVGGTSFTNDRKEVSAQTDFQLPNPAAPVAVLTSKLTASAGEAVAIVFRGRPASRSFGEPTTGIPTYNVRVRMADGAFLDIMQAVDIDRTGQAYDGPVPPDEVVPIDWKQVGTADDPVLGAAIRWLSAQGSCPAT
jgi:carboxyl-terminal processing protease